MKKSILLLFLFNACASQPPVPPTLAVPNATASAFTATGQHFAIAAQGKESTKAAEEMFEAGGNIIDAAVAVSFAISVERPQSTGIGGGGFLLFHEAESGQTFAVDFRERAPLKATRDMFLDKNGNFQAEKSLNGPLSAATPGLVAGLLEVHDRWGRLELANVMAPAIRIAERGLVVTEPLAKALKSRREVLLRDPAARAIFLKKDSSPYNVGEKIVQKDLARTLRAIAQRGRAGFYKGSVAAAIAKSQKSQGGLLTQNDLDAYQVKWREPLRGTFHDLEVLSMPPPSSGGIHVLQVLNMLEHDPLDRFGHLSTKSIHLTASSLQLAFADRAHYPGDPDFVKVPVERLISKDYAKARRAEIPSSHARPSSEVQPGSIPKEESPETTHFSILDRAGNAVASTQTINYAFGSGVVVPGTGVLLNDEMDDFSAKPGAANAYGALGGEANSIAPAKTPLSSMAPTIVLRDGLPVMAVGAPGGTRIISCVAETILNYFAYKMPAYESVAAVRLHHQWMPDRLDIELPGPSAKVVKELGEYGYQTKITPGVIPCRVELAVREADDITAVTDPRDAGLSIAR